MIERVAIVGAGRVGLTLGRALVRCGTAVTMLSRRQRTLPAPLPATPADWMPTLRGADLVIIAVPDDAIAASASALEIMRVLTPQHTVLHCSGLHDRTQLGVLEPSGAALGSIHIVQSFTAPLGEPDMLGGSPAVIEGDGRALAVAHALAKRLELAPIITIAGDRKAPYHAAAVFASNYLVVLADIAGRLAREAGLGDAGSTVFLPLMHRTLAHLASGDAARALTGPIRRGDVGTIGRHLDALDGEDRAAYRVLAMEALQVARRAGLDDDAARQIEQLLATAQRP